MDQACVENLLDDGWSLVGRFHQWLSEFPAASSGRESVVELIDGLQHLWSVSDDLGLKRVGRICLGLEQLLERFCSRSLAFSAVELKELLTLNVSCLQEILLGLEATREEPEIPDLESVRRLERYSLQTVWLPATEMIPIDESIASLPFELATVPTAESDNLNLLESSAEQEIPVYQGVDDGLLAMLEHFVAQLDETCQRLHGRMIADETPYASTTSRLEHLAASTRELVGQIAERSRQQVQATDRRYLDESVSSITGHVAESLEFANGPADGFQSPATVEDESIIPLEFASALTNDDENLSDFVEEYTAQQAAKPLRILIVEESLFYRHLISMAVQSAGFEPCMAESVTNGLETLEQSTDFSAILIGETISADMAQIIAERRESHGLKVIGLAQAEVELNDREGVDDHVLRSRPQQIITVLNELFRQSDDSMRLSA